MAIITITYNNISHNPYLRSDWGFSCFIEGLSKNILFDTGSDGDILLYNLKKLNIDLRRIDLIFISHLHFDHIGGLQKLLSLKENIPVFLPEGRYNLKNFFVIKKFTKITEDAYSTGPLGKTIKEQSLVIETKNGFTIITGCAHPGVSNIVEYVKNIVKREIYLVIGGFHLMGLSKKAICEIIDKFKQLGVKYVAPSHCTGEAAIKLFQKAYGKNFLDGSLGEKLKI